MGEWSFLKQLKDEGKIDAIDWTFALSLAQGMSEKEAALVTLLSAACRQGHICIQLDKGTLTPSLQDLFQELNANEIKRFNDLIKESKVPRHVVTVDSLYYFERFYHFEKEIIENFNRILNAKPHQSIPSEQISKSLQNNSLLLPEQKQAIETIGSQCLSVICGGPGTGKTFTAAQIVKTIWLTLSDEERFNFKIVLAAPTGKATSNMEMSLNKAVSDIENFCSIEAKTIHSLLGLGSKRKQDVKVRADLVIIDECSMIDVAVMKTLLCSIKSGTRLIFLGDPHQLPPVEAGSLFTDFVAILKSMKSKALTELKECKRVELKTILDFAEAVNTGDAYKALAQINGSDCGLARLKLEPAKPEELVLQVEQRFKSRYQNENPKELLDSFQSFRLLTPLRRGLFGVETLNRLISQKIRHKLATSDIYVAPILLVKNDYRLNLWNGEVGVLVQKKRDDDCIQKGDYALFEDREPIPALLLPKFEYAYCLSVHKSQGSEFDEVLLLMPEGSEVFGREVLYTAATRAKKKLTIFATDDSLSHTINKVSFRMSGVRTNV